MTEAERTEAREFARMIAADRWAIVTRCSARDCERMADFIEHLLKLDSLVVGLKRYPKIFRIHESN